MDSLAQYLDFANHHAHATPADIEKLSDTVIKYGFHAVFVNPVHVVKAKAYLKEKNAPKIPVGTVISFPLGGDTEAIKMSAANNAVSQGADELDVVPDISLFLSGATDAFHHELQSVVESAHMLGKPIIVKFILDPGYFDALPDRPKQLSRAAELVRASGADYIKLGSGMGPRNPSLDDLKIIKDTVGSTIKIKVAGGVETRDQAEAILNAGANRIGTSHAVDIIQGTGKQTGKKGE